jgi:hypothetical protein
MPPELPVPKVEMTTLATFLFKNMTEVAIPGLA